MYSKCEEHASPRPITPNIIAMMLVLACKVNINIAELSSMSQTHIILYFTVIFEIPLKAHYKKTLMSIQVYSIAMLSSLKLSNQPINLPWVLPHLTCIYLLSKYKQFERFSLTWGVGKKIYPLGFTIYIGVRRKGKFLKPWHATLVKYCGYTFNHG